MNNNENTNVVPEVTSNVVPNTTPVMTNPEPVIASPEPVVTSPEPVIASPTAVPATPEVAVTNPVLEDNNQVVNDNPGFDSVMPPTVAPPIANNNTNQMGEDNRILKPIVEELVPTTTSEVTGPRINIDTDAMKNKNAPKAEKKQDDTLQNVKMEKIQIEYKPPGAFKTFIMFFMFIVILGSIIFLPEISTFLSQFNNHDENPIDIEDVIDGTLTCSIESNDDKFDYIDSYEFTFKNQLLKNVTYNKATKGDRVIDSQVLDTLKNSCTILSTALSSGKYGVNVDCDSVEGTVTISQAVDFEALNADEAEKLFKENDIEFVEYEENENILNIERNLKSSGYTCEMTRGE